MLKKTITYTNFNGDEESEDHYFHLSESELVELQVSRKDGLAAFMERIIKAEDHATLVAEFKSIILLSYGQRSSDGRSFEKNDALREKFVSTQAYNALFMELATETDKATEFINGIIPSAMLEKVTTATQSGKDEEEEEPSEKPKMEVIPGKEEVERKVQVFTPKQIREMTPEDVKGLGARIASGEIVIRDE